MEIKFGTDGWRGIIAKDFTFVNLRAVAQATADYFKTVCGKNRKAIVGYDLRFFSEKYAAITADILASNGFQVILSSAAVTTPTVSYGVVSKKAFFGIMITSSHNPYEYSGFKIKTANGASATKEETNGVEAFLFKNKVKEGLKAHKTSDLTTPYLSFIKTFVDMKKINKSSFKVIIEPMYGSSQGLLLEVLKHSRLKLFPLHHFRDAMFGGIKPEPLDFLLKDAKDAVKKEKAAIGLVTDGDGDRFAIIDDKGIFYSTQHIMPLLMEYLLKSKGLRGGVVITTATTSAAEVIARRNGLRRFYTPIGFKNIADLMLKEDILIGAEESGGIGVKGYLPERDGILLGLMLLEMIAETAKKPSELLKDLENKYGSFCYDRLDIKYPSEQKNYIFNTIEKFNPTTILGKKVKSISREDGAKYTMEDLSWLVLRPSGTEPILRVYAEAGTKKRVVEYLTFGKKLTLR
ncbi:MAG: phosphoglucomutase/phosphomannomutase family protein [Candidatus Firestonebacteria bacterium]|nr:phosphoglucomutase/phosphomannomutase family protein [Candidatus Firestonebacteria bacterium]